ncbi:MAG: sialate O-acetylesterase [Blautia sp.]|nr:sialate O-acetylesterase [Blautia sp.]
MGKTIDLFLFMGQSNMAGRGIVTQEHCQGAPRLLDGAGYEYRAVSDPDRLYVMEEPFGRFENRPGGIDDGHMKTGSMVTAFANVYYIKTGVPIVGVSASKGGSRIDQWQSGGIFLQDATARLEAAVDFLQDNHFSVRHKFMLWCQGESDGDIAKPGEQYRAEFERMLDHMLQAGIEKCFLVRIGHYNGSGGQDYSEIMAAQDEIARTNENVVMVSESLAKMKERGLMKDDFHYFQEAYNIVGREAGENTADYVLAMQAGRL